MIALAGSTVDRVVAGAGRFRMPMSNDGVASLVTTICTGAFGVGTLIAGSESRDGETLRRAIVVVVKPELGVPASLAARNSRYSGESFDSFSSVLSFDRAPGS